MPHTVASYLARYGAHLMCSEGTDLMILNNGHSALPKKHLAQEALR
jgi:hypothetical protein